MFEPVPEEPLDPRVPRGRRASDQTPIGRIIGPIERAWGTGDYALAAELLERNAVVAWYGLSKERLREILASLEHEGYPGTGMLSVIRGVVAFGTPGYAPEVPTDPVDVDSVPATHELARRMFALRLQGRMVEALKVSTELTRQFEALPSIVDMSSGWELLITVQHGIIAMLAGDFPESLRAFARARAYPVAPSLTYLVRDAYAKAAIVEALYGDASQAKVLIEDSGCVPRTESWAEFTVDASLDLATAILETEDYKKALRRLESFPLGAIIELSPFHAVAMQSALRAGREWRRAGAWTDTVRGLRFPAREADGFSGSVVPYLETVTALQSGDLAAARIAIARADASLPMTTLLSARIDIAAGNPRAAFPVLLGMGAQTKSLRTLDLWRLLGAAEALLALGDEAQARKVLAHAHALPGGILPADVRGFPAPAQKFAETNIQGWPRSSDDVPGFNPGTLLQVEAFTERELSALRALATGRSREQIAKDAFISINTLKAHLRSVYRKLGATSRTAAILEAERRGLI